MLKLIYIYRCAHQHDMAERAGWRGYSRAGLALGDLHAQMLW